MTQPDRSELGIGIVVSGTGELARCLQHETDHLKGELFIDGLDDAERRRVMRQIYADQIVGRPSAPRDRQHRRVGERIP